jgi:hypothetical protein
MYNMLFGNGERGHFLLAQLGFKSLSEVGRYRDGWLEKGENKVPRIAIYTRNGGGNRENLEEVFNKLKSHPDYLFDKDDDYDNTYATIYFKCPKDLTDILTAEEPGWEDKIQDQINMGEVWQAVIKAMRDEEIK